MNIILQLALIWKLIKEILNSTTTNQSHLNLSISWLRLGLLLVISL